MSEGDGAGKTMGTEDHKEHRQPALKRIVTMSGAYEMRNYTVRDLIEAKGKRQLVQVMAFTPEEAEAAEAAGIDLINVRWLDHDRQLTTAIRCAAPHTFMTFCLPPTLAASEAEALRAAFMAMEAGADGIYCAWSMRFTSVLAEAGIPVQGHAGLVPRKSTWTGGLRAVGKTIEQARGIHQTMRDLVAAGAWAVECEVIPHKILEVLSRHTPLVTVSLGSGAGGDVQYLFAEDILGETAGSPPRHARAYRNFHERRRELQADRIAAFGEFASDVRGGSFPARSNLVAVDDAVVSELEALFDKL